MIVNANDSSGIFFPCLYTLAHALLGPPEKKKWTGCRSMAVEWLKAAGGRVERTGNDCTAQFHKTQAQALNPISYPPFPLSLRPRIPPIRSAQRRLLFSSFPKQHHSLQHHPLELKWLFASFQVSCVIPTSVEFPLLPLRYSSRPGKGHHDIY